MTSLFCGIAGFFLYFLYDINSITIRSKLLHTAFVIGTVLIAVATGIDLYAAWKMSAFSGSLDFLLFVMSVVCFVALIYCLFFALPFHETYSEQAVDRSVYSKGVYALCRHPGILCFFGMFLFLGTSALPSDLLLHGMLFSLLNLTYGIFQDKITFPKIFFDYHTYRKQVPFLIPSKESFRLAWNTRPCKDSEEDES